ncbi:MAG: prepilin peptidase [Bdellovibrionales bacterium]
MFDEFLNLPKGILVLFFFVIGSIFGSFANVLIYRLQLKEPFNLWNRSYCPSCKKLIPFYLNIPIFSWFFLRGRCQNCKASFSFRYPFVEFLTASLFALLFLSIGWNWFLLEALIFAFGLVVVSFIDLDQMILPDSFTLSGIVLGLVGGFLNPERYFLDSLLGCFLGGFLLLFIAYAYYLFRKQEGVGGGDIKLLAWIGAVLGWQSLSFVLIVSSFLGTIVGAILILCDKKFHIQTALPFGPYLALGALFYIFLRDLENIYLNFIIPF